MRCRSDAAGSDMVLHTVWLRTANCVLLSNSLGLVLGLFQLKRTTAGGHLEYGVLDVNPPHIGSHHATPVAVLQCAELRFCMHPALVCIQCMPSVTATKLRATTLRPSTLMLPNCS